VPVSAKDRLCEAAAMYAYALDGLDESAMEQAEAPAGKLKG
jgi:hypothetical protein